MECPTKDIASGNEQDDHDWVRKLMEDTVRVKAKNQMMMMTMRMKKLLRKKATRMLEEYLLRLEGPIAMTENDKKLWNKAMEAIKTHQVETVRKMMKDKSIDELKKYVETEHWENEVFKEAEDFIRDSQQVKLHKDKGNVRKQPDTDEAESDKDETEILYATTTAENRLGNVGIPENTVKYDTEVVDKDSDEEKKEYNEDPSDEETVWLDFLLGLMDPSHWKNQ
jgi:hypothetical protein